MTDANMHISENGLAIIKKSEGLSLEAYVDTHDSQGAPIYAIGYGHRTQAGPPTVLPGMVITDAQADQILKQDMVAYENYVKRIVKVPLNINQFDALDRKSTRLNSSHIPLSRMPSSA